MKKPLNKVKRQLVGQFRGNLTKPSLLHVFLRAKCRVKFAGKQSKTRSLSCVNLALLGKPEVSNCSGMRPILHAIKTTEFMFTGNDNGDAEVSVT